MNASDPFALLQMLCICTFQHSLLRVVCLVTMCSSSLMHTHVNETGRSFAGSYAWPFLKMGHTFAVFQSDETWPESIDFWRRYSNINILHLF